MPVAAILNDPVFWNRARDVMVPVARRVFREAYLVGAALAAREQPEGWELRRRNPLVALGEMIRVGARAVGDGNYPGVTGYLPDPPDGMDFTPLPFDFDAIATAAEDAINQYTDEWWGQVSASTQRSMRRTMIRALDEGWTNAQISRAFEPLFGEVRAMRIAIAETTTLMGRGAMATYQRAGFGRWIWRTSEDAAVDPDCAALARASDPKKGGTPFPMTRQFNRAHVGCRCWPVPYGDPKDTRVPLEPELQLPEGSQYGTPGWFDTEAVYSKPGPQGRIWDARRVEQVHNPIVAELTGKATRVQSPTAYMMGGGPASGKSTVIDRGFVKVPDNIVAIDPDGIKAMLPEYQRMVGRGDPRAAGFVHEESSYLSKRVLSEAASGGKNVLLDGTGDSGIDKLAGKVREMRAGGQRVVAQYVSLDTELAVRNATARAIKTGRAVDENVIRNTHRAVSEVFPEAIERGLFDEVTLWDTNINGQPRKVLEAAKDAQGVQRVTIHDRQLWSDFLGKANLRPGGFSFELNATYPETATLGRRTAAEMRESILNRDEIAELAGLDDAIAGVRARYKTHTEQFSDVFRKQRAAGLPLDGPNYPGTPLHLHKMESERLRDELGGMLKAKARDSERARQRILEDGIFADTPAEFEVNADWIDRLRGRGGSAASAARERLQQGINDFKRLVGPKSPVQGKTVNFRQHRAKRDYFVRGSNGGTVSVSTSTQSETVVHEMGHWLESHAEDVQTARKAHIAARTAGERAQPLSRIYPGYGYGRDEIALKDEFFNAYAGKVYSGRPDSSELISMGLEEMYARPWELARKDPRLFDFVYDLLMSWR